MLYGRRRRRWVVGAVMVLASIKGLLNLSDQIVGTVPRTHMIISMSCPEMCMYTHNHINVLS